MPLDTPEFARDIGAAQPDSKRVPVLQARRAARSGIRSRSANTSASSPGRGWPADRAARAVARAVCAEMHAGFAHPAFTMAHECARAQAAHTRRTRNARPTSRASKSCGANAARVSARGGPWLFGEYSVADAMYAPVVLRLRTYGARAAARLDATTWPRCSPTRTCGTGCGGRGGELDHRSIRRSGD